MARDLLDDFTRTTFTFGGKERTVYRQGEGTAVIVMAEIPGITPAVASFARRVVARGHTVYLPHLFGDPGAEMTPAGVVRAIVPSCVSKEFQAFALRTTPPAIDWLRALARQAHQECGGPGVGAVGMCFTGGFALAMATEPEMLAPVLSQPSLPIALNGARAADLGCSDEDLLTVTERARDDGLCVLGLRFTGDRLVPGALRQPAPPARRQLHRRRDRLVQGQPLGPPRHGALGAHRGPRRRARPAHPRRARAGAGLLRRAPRRPPAERPHGRAGGCQGPTGRVAEMSRDDLLEGLNPAQLEAVIHTDGPLLVVAGAGSGKTRVLTHRIAHLIDEHQVSPFEILAITFTNKAADEMKRARRPASSGRWPRRCGCPRSTRRACASCGATAQLLGYPSSFTIYDQADAVRLTGYVHPRPGPRPQAVPAPGRARRDLGAKNDGRQPDDATPSGRRSSSSARSPRSTPSTRRRLREAGAMDFDDLLLRHRRAVPRPPRGAGALPAPVPPRPGRRVPGHQPRPERAGASCWRAEHRNVCVVGDSDQSIYRFRGADIRNILEFEKAFPDATVVVLEQNYRSTQTILDAANAVIANNLARKPKELWTESGRGRQDHPLPRRRRGRRGRSGSPTRWPACTTAATCAGATSPSSTGPTPRAGCSRSSSCASGIPYKVVGGTRFYDRREIKDALAYLKAVVNPTDEVSVKRVLNVPKRGVGDRPSVASTRYARSHGITFVDALRRWRRGRASPPASAAGHRVVPDHARRPGRATWRSGRPRCSRRSLERSGLPGRAATPSTRSRPSRAAGEPGRAGRHGPRVRRRSTSSSSRSRWWPTPTSCRTDDPSETGVVMMTLHAAKGLEFPVVFMVGMEDGVFPHLRALAEPGRARGGAAPLLRRHHPRPRAALPDPRVVPHAVRRHPVQPAEPVPRRDPRRRWSRSPRPAGAASAPVAVRGPARRLGSRRRGRRRARERQPRAVADPAQLAAAHPGATSWASRSATTCATTCGARASCCIIEGSGDKTEAVVHFPSVGEKRLLLSWAPLEKA